MVRTLLVGLLAAATVLAACASAEEDRTAAGNPSPTPTADTGGSAPATPAPGAGTPAPDLGTPGEPSPAVGEPSEPAHDAVAGRWRRLADAPLALTEVAAAPFGGSVWTAGGFDEDGEAVARVLVYDPTFDTWDDGPPLPEVRHHAALVSSGDALHLLGGYTDSSFDTPTAAVLVLDPATGDWADGPALPEPRAAGAAAWDGSRVVYAGGRGPERPSGDVWALEDGEWRAIGELSEAREHLAAASDADGLVWFLGGRTGGFDTNLAAVDVVDGDRVRPAGALPTPRGGVAGLHLPGIGACALGGEGPDGTFGDVECVDGNGDVAVLPDLAVARHGLGAVVVEGTAYAVLGGPEPGLFVSPVLEAFGAGTG